MREYFGRYTIPSFKMVMENTFNKKDFVQIPYEQQPLADYHLLLFLDHHSKKMLDLTSLGVLC